MKDRAESNANRILDDYSDMPGMTTQALVAERADLSALLNVIHNRVAGLKRRISEINRIIRTRENKYVNVTDHVLVQYMRRVKGIDVETYRDEIKQMLLRANAAEPLRSDAKAYRVDGLIFVVVGNGNMRAVTVYPEPMLKAIAPAVTEAAVDVPSEKIDG